MWRTNNSFVVMLTVMFGEGGGVCDAGSVRCLELALFFLLFRLYYSMCVLRFLAPGIRVYGIEDVVMVVIGVT